MKNFEEKIKRYIVLLIICVMMVGLFPTVTYATDHIINLYFRLDDMPKPFEDVVKPTPKTGAPLYYAAGGSDWARVVSFTKDAGNKYTITDASLSYTGSWHLEYLGENSGYIPFFNDQPLPITSSPLYVYLNYYTVTFKDGDTVIDTQIVLSGQNAEYGGEIPTKQSDAQYSYAFSKWVTTAGGSTNATLTNITAPKTVYASFAETLRSYTITFDSAGGSTVSNINQDFGTDVVAPQPPTKTGYTFTGWSPAIPATMPAANSNLVAQWSVNSYNISFDSAGGSAVAPISQNFGTDVVAPQPPTKTGYTFTGWSPAVPATMPAANSTLVAQWSVNSYTISFDSAGGSSVTPIIQNFGTPLTAPIAPTRTGYTFAGWSPGIPTTMPAENITLVAQWTINQYRITFDSNGGTAVNTKTQDFGTPVTTPIAPTRTGYNFLSWSEKVPTTMPAINMTLVANWKANTPAAPLPDTVTAKTDTSLTIATQPGYEYRVNGKDWYSGAGSYTFTGLTAGTPYNLTCRVAMVTSGYTSTASDESNPLTVSTKSTGSITAPTTDTVTYDPAKTLADITLPANWAWSAPTTVPTVAISSYHAVYTPTDTATVDYSGVTGYADTSGTVTITQAIGLTINPATPTAADFNYTRPELPDYSGTAKTATVTTNDGISGMGTITIKYYQDGVEIEPINAGTYSVRINIADGGNYTSADSITDGSWVFTIEKISQAPISIENIPGSITYGDKPFTISTTGGSGTGNVTWAVTDGNSANVDEKTGLVIISGTNETAITVTKAADGNYTADVTDTYTFTPSRLQLTIDSPTTEGSWTKVYDGSTEFDKSSITVGGIINKVGEDDVTVLVDSAAYNTKVVGSGNKELTIVYTISGNDSEKYFTPENTEIDTASITPAAPIVTIVGKTSVYSGSIIEISEATVTGVASEKDITVNYEGEIIYTYYTKDTCTEADKTTVDKSGAEHAGGAPKYRGTYYVKATIAADGNYTEASSAVVKLTIYNPSSGEHLTSAPVIIDGETIDIGKSDVKDNSTTVVLDQTKMAEQLNNAKDSVVIPITSKTATSSAQLVLKNIEVMNERGVELTIIAGSVSYSIPSDSIDTEKILKALGATDSTKVVFNISISKMSNTSVTISQGTLVIPPVAFTVTATYDGKSVSVEKFGNYVQRVIEIPEGTDPESITTAVVGEVNGTYSHVPTSVFQKDGKWYASINSLTNSIYSVIWNPVTVASVENHWAKSIVNDMASRLIIKNPETFMPNQSITRGEFAEYITKALGIYRSGVVSTQKFSDVLTSNELAASIEIASEYGIITGYPDGTFKPNAKISREEAMVMYSRAMDVAGLKEKDFDRIESYTDKESVAGWAYNGVKKTLSAGVFNGKTKDTINPKDSFTCAEAATAIRNLLVASGLINE
jgi:hypothetical protein